MPVQPTMHDKVAVRQLVKDYTAAWNRLDAIAYGQPFAEDAECWAVWGVRVQGRAAITQAHREVFRTRYKDTRLDTQIESIRFIRIDAAWIQAISKLHYANDGFQTMLAAVIAVKDNSDWRIVALINAGILPTEPAEPARDTKR